MKKDITTKILTEKRLVAVIRADDMEQAIKIADACIAGGIGAVEITYTVPGATHIIEELKKKHAKNGVLIGAGTVIDSETARCALLAGADFIVSPTTDQAMVSLCNRYRAVCIAGAFTPNEVKQALEYGADYIKIFPATLCEPSYLRALHGPFPQADFMVTGSMGFDTVTEWLKNGAALIGVGGLITDPAAHGDFAKTTENAARLCSILEKYLASK